MIYSSGMDLCFAHERWNLSERYSRETEREREGAKYTCKIWHTSKGGRKPQQQGGTQWNEARSCV